MFVFVFVFVFVVWTTIKQLRSPCQVSGNAAWASEMAEALRAELAAAEAVQAGEGPWLTVTASFAHQAGRDPTSTR